MRPIRRSALSTLFGSLAVALVSLAYPLYVIQPRRHQDPRELQVALFALHWQHIVEIGCAVIALAALLLVLRTKPTVGARIRTMAAAALVVVCAALSFVNIFEVMFHPAGAPAFQAARAAKLGGDEKVIAVSARAYPIRIISYHHIVNDTEDGVPIAVTS